MNYWENKRVWVTGGTGFLGKAIVDRLTQGGCSEVVATGRRDGDLTELASIRSLLKDIKPDLIIHLAAVVGGIGANMAHPAEFFYQNLMMGAQLMHEMLRKDQLTDLGSKSVGKAENDTLASN
jgi:GDP-L-fucose synthase